MAALSSVYKYTIDGVEIPAYPSSVTPSHNLVSKSWNDMYGVFRDIPVNSKLKINWVFDMIQERDLNKLWGDMIYNKLIRTGSRFFEINTAFPGLGFIKGTFYLGTPTTFNSKDWQSTTGGASWYQCELHWIEVDGIVLNKPSDIVSGFTVNINGNTIYLEGENNKSIVDIINKEG